MIESPNLRISITPEPSEQEKAALVAAVIASMPKPKADPPARPVNKWRAAGKREALRGED